MTAERGWGYLAGSSRISSRMCWESTVIAGGLRPRGPALPGHRSHRAGAEPSDSVGGSPQGGPDPPAPSHVSLEGRVETALSTIDVPEHRIGGAGDGDHVRPPVGERH